ncbi:MAG: lipoyl(octanoyl) transferase LipB [Prevotellaceae bacterium]|jgi:lipoyl(octanoyl) transferase|nr:lipoyl(octanoyl) transferase LipB [Prevotellaceae bacterium]
MKKVDWQIIEYQAALAKQEEIFNRTIELKKQGLPVENYLIFCEHPHVYTIGKSGNEQNMLLDDGSVPVFRTNRGGDITYHGFGQVVGYPIFDLENLNVGLKEYIHKIEMAIINLLAIYGIKSEQLNGATGVWLDTDNPARCRKICAIGVRSSRFVTMHGFALNVNTDLNYFSRINPCGFTDKGVTSMQKELGQMLDLEKIKQQLFLEIEKIFL